MAQEYCLWKNNGKQDAKNIRLILRLARILSWILPHFRNCSSLHFCCQKCNKADDFLSFDIFFFNTPLNNLTCHLQVRRCVRPYFVGSKSVKRFYDVLTCISTRLILSYATFSFILLEFKPSITLYLWVWDISYSDTSLLKWFIFLMKPLQFSGTCTWFRTCWVYLQSLLFQKY